MKTYILYHGNCPDGFGAATAAWIKLGSDAEYVPVNYGKPPPEMEAGSKVFILDFSYPRQQLLEMARRMKRVVVLDHHATAETDLAGLELPGDDSEIQFDMNKSGAVLAWEFFHDGDTPDFMLYLQDRDLWRFQLPGSREVSCALRSYPMEFELWACFATNTDELMKLVTEGIACLRLTNQQVEIMARNARWMMFGGGTVQPAAAVPGEREFVQIGADTWLAPVANATVFFSEVGEKLLELHPQAVFSAYYGDRSDGKRQFGLRSRPDFDCSVVAKAFGGGGHKQASGFVL